MIGNIARRVLHIIREEVEADEEGQEEELDIGLAAKDQPPALGGLSKAFRYVWDGIGLWQRMPCTARDPGGFRIVLSGALAFRVAGRRSEPVSGRFPCTHFWTTMPWKCQR